MRTATQEGEIGSNADLGVVGCHTDLPTSIVIASEAKQSIHPLVALWIASSLRSSQ
jgi:hypothetical protein